MNVSQTHPTELVLGFRAGVHEGLSDDGQGGVHDLAYVHVENEVGILQDVHPETQGQTETTQTGYYSRLTIYLVDFKDLGTLFIHSSSELHNGRFFWGVLSL